MNQDKSSHGGRRPNAGRKAGSATTKTREIADKAAKDGITPLEVILKAMTVNLKAYEDTQSMDALQAAALFAKDAAPYVHPKLSSVEMDAKVTARTLDQEIAELNATLGHAASNH